MPERARQIMEAAMELADQGGFDAVRLRDVASKAQVALGTLYARFASKEDILVAVLEQEAGKLETLLQQFPSDAESAEERVVYFFGVATQAMFARQNFARAVLRAVSAGTSETAEKIARYHERLTRLIVGALQGVDANVAVPTGWEPEVAYLLQQLWFAALVGWMTGIREEDEVMDQMRRATRLLLRGAQA